MITNKKIIMRKICRTLIALLTMCVVHSKAQVPSDWTINPFAYQYQMTITGIANENCINLSDTNNYVAAFVNGQCRGSVKTKVEYFGDKMAFLYIKSNVVSGEYVTFKIYKASTNTVLNVLDSVSFNQGATIGQLTNPFMFKTNHAPTNVSLSNTSIIESVSINTLVGSLSANDNDPVATFTYSLTANQPENSQFAISGNQLFTNALYNFETDNYKTIEIATTDNNGCTSLNTFAISILNDNDAPDALSLIAQVVSDGQTANSFIGKLYTHDPDANDTYTYSLVSGTGDVDNAQFYIRNDSVFNVNQIFYSVQSSFQIRARTTDAGGLFYESPFIISVTLANAAPTDIVLDNSSVDENKAIGTSIGVFTVLDPNTSDTQTLTLTSGPGSDDNALVTLVGNELKTSAIYDYDVKPTLLIRLIAIDNGGGTFAKSFAITVNDVSAENIPFKSSDFISPNGDGKNDFWIVDNVALYKDYSLQIFDHFGQIIYQKADSYNNEFDGRVNGKQLPNGNYYYLLKGKTKEFKGNIAVVN